MHTREEEVEAKSTMRTEEDLNTDNPPNPTNTEVQEEEEPNLFDILNEDVNEIDEDDPIDDKQIADNEEEDN